jgi:flagellar hook-length control protein FliK
MLTVGNQGIANLLMGQSTGSPRLASAKSRTDRDPPSSHEAETPNRQPESTPRHRDEARTSSRNDSQAASTAAKAKSSADAKSSKKADRDEKPVVDGVQPQAAETQPLPTAPAETTPSFASVLNQIGQADAAGQLPIVSSTEGDNQQAATISTATLPPVMGVAGQAPTADIGTQTQVEARQTEQVAAVSAIRPEVVVADAALKVAVGQAGQPSTEKAASAVPSAEGAQALPFQTALATAEAANQAATSQAPQTPVVSVPVARQPVAAEPTGSEPQGGGLMGGGDRSAGRYMNGALTSGSRTRLNDTAAQGTTDGTSASAGSTLNSTFTLSSSQDQASAAAVSAATRTDTTSETPTAAAPSTHTEALRQAVETPVSDQIAQSLRGLNLRADRQLVVRLSPPDLGDVRVTLRTIGNQVHGVLEAENPETFRRLEREASGLVSRLQDSGIQVQRLDVTLSRQDGGSASDNQMAWDGSRGSSQDGGGSQRDAQSAPSLARAAAEAVASADTTLEAAAVGSLGINVRA